MFLFAISLAEILDLPGTIFFVRHNTKVQHHAHSIKAKQVHTKINEGERKQTV